MTRKGRRRLVRIGLFLSVALVGELIVTLTFSASRHFDQDEYFLLLLAGTAVGHAMFSLASALPAGGSRRLAVAGLAGQLIGLSLHTALPMFDGVSFVPHPAFQLLHQLLHAIRAGALLTAPLLYAAAGLWHLRRRARADSAPRATRSLAGKAITGLASVSLVRAGLIVLAIATLTVPGIEGSIGVGAFVVVVFLAIAAMVFVAGAIFLGSGASFYASWLDFLIALARDVDRSSQPECGTSS